MKTNSWKNVARSAAVAAGLFASSAFAEETPNVNEAPAIESGMMVGLAEGVTAVRLRGGALRL